MKIGDRVFVSGYIDEIRKDTVIIRNAGGYFGTIPSEVITGELPPAQPETTRRIVGKSKGGMTLWYECERCGEPVDEGDKFCRGCGAKMEVTT